MLFLVGGFLAWYSWTRIARPNVFHVQVYTPPLGTTLIATATICGLFFMALGPPRNALSLECLALRPPPSWLLGIAGASWAVVWYGLVLLGFGIAPSFPPWVAVGVGVFLAACILLFLPAWATDPRWHNDREFAVIFGTMLGSMVAGFVGFIGAAPMDLYFKILVNLLAVALLIKLGLRVRKPC
jgi:hypothetical protein